MYESILNRLISSKKLTNETSSKVKQIQKIHCNNYREACTEFQAGFLITFIGHSKIFSVRINVFPSLI